MDRLEKIWKIAIWKIWKKMENGNLEIWKFGNFPSCSELSQLHIGGNYYF
jgi:hypothetical protein